MAKGKLFYILLFLFTVHLSGAQDRNIPIGKEAGGKPIFTFDTVQLKEYFEGFLPDSFAVQSPFFDEMSIEKGLLESHNTTNTAKEYYFLLLRNYKHKLKLALTLHKKGNEFFLFAKTPEMTEDDIELNSRYLICYGTDEDCFPQLYVDPDGETSWTSTSSQLLICDPEDPCMQVSGLLLFDK